MTRVSDALARAAVNTTPPVNDDNKGNPADHPVDSWPSERQDEHALPEFEALETIAPVEEAPVDRLLVPDEQRINEKLMTGQGLPAGSVEQYRRLAARLHLSQVERGTRSVMVTSAVVGEGKTLTATNLALTLSESYKRRVLLIDADLRHPWVHELFKVPNVTGLNDGIRSDTERKVPIIRISAHLSVLTAGRPDPDPMSVLSSDRMRRVLTDAARSFDWVIVDTPPVAVLSDAHLLATLVDTVVLVVRAGSTQFAAMQQAVDAVGRDRILGVVLNCADEPRQASYHYYGYGLRSDRPATL